MKKKRKHGRRKHRRNPGTVAGIGVGILLVVIEALASRVTYAALPAINGQPGATPKKIFAELWPSLAGYYAGKKIWPGHPTAVLASSIITGILGAANVWLWHRDPSFSVGAVVTVNGDHANVTQVDWDHAQVTVAFTDGLHAGTQATVPFSQVVLVKTGLPVLSPAPTS